MKMLAVFAIILHLTSALELFSKFQGHVRKVQNKSIYARVVVWIETIYLSSSLLKRAQWSWPFLDCFWSPLEEEHYVILKENT